MSAAHDISPRSAGPLNIGILAGGGALPRLVAESAISDGHRVHIVGVEGEAGKNISAFSHSWMKWGQVGRMFGHFHDAGCTDIVIIGSVKRPDLKKIRIDVGAIRSLPTLLGILAGGDDAILSGIVSVFEKNGLRIRGAHEIAPTLLAEEGLLAGPQPTPADHIDIEKGMAVLTALGGHDVGQGVVVAKRYVLGIEAAEGTDELLRRANDLRQWGNSWLQRKRVGVFVKTPKPGQELRVDMPTVGPQTVRLVVDAGLAGMAIVAQRVLLVDREETIQLANEAGVFILGMPIGETPIDPSTS